MHDPRIFPGRKADSKLIAWHQKKAQPLGYKAFPGGSGFFQGTGMLSVRAPAAFQHHRRVCFPCSAGRDRGWKIRCNSRATGLGAPSLVATNQRCAILERCCF